MGRICVFIKNDLDRYSLNYLDIVSCWISRWKEGENSPRPCHIYPGKTFYGKMYGATIHRVLSIKNRLVKPISYYPIKSAKRAASSNLTEVVTNGVAMRNSNPGYLAKSKSLKK